METLAARGVSSIAFDLPGHGASPVGSIATEPASPAKTAAEQVLAELKAMDHDARWHVAGHSFGGAVAGIMALLDAARIASLALIAPGGFGPEINTQAMHAYAAAGTPDAMQAALTPFFAKADFANAGLAARHLATRQRPGVEAHLLELANRIAPLDGGQGVLPLEKIAAKGLPSAVLWGEADAILPASRAHALPGADVTLLPGIGHMPHEERPDQLAAWLLARIAPN
jgi:pimeloyl-ACP methyl ester carboxylesterase